MNPMMLDSLWFNNECLFWALQSYIFAIMRDFMRIGL